MPQFCLLDLRSVSFPGPDLTHSPDGTRILLLLPVSAVGLAPMDTSRAIAENFKTWEVSSYDLVPGLTVTIITFMEIFQYAFLEVWGCVSGCGV